MFQSITKIVCLILRDDNGVSRFLIKKQGLQYLFGGRLFDEWVTLCILYMRVDIWDMVWSDSFYLFCSLESIIERYKKEFIEQGLSLGNPVARVTANFTVN